MITLKSILNGLSDQAINKVVASSVIAGKGGRGRVPTGGTSSLTTDGTDSATSVSSESSISSESTTTM